MYYLFVLFSVLLSFSAHAKSLIDPSFLADCNPIEGQLSCNGNIYIAEDGGYGLESFPKNIEGLPAGRGSASAQSSAKEILSLGSGGYITLKFVNPVKNGPGADIRIFENTFLLQDATSGQLDKYRSFTELAFVEVSQDGQTFYRFEPRVNDTEENFFVNPYNFHNLAGVFPTLANKNIDAFGPQVIDTKDNTRALLNGPGGDDFDLSDLAQNLEWIQYVRIIDVNGRIEDFGDKFQGGNTSGFDLDAVVGLH